MTRAELTVLLLGGACHTPESTGAWSAWRGLEVGQYWYAKEPKIGWLATKKGARLWKRIKTGDGPLSWEELTIDD